MPEMKVSDFKEYFKHVSGEKRKRLHGGITYRINSGASRDEIIDYIKSEVGSISEQSEPHAYTHEARGAADKTASLEPRNHEIPQHKIAAVIREMEALQTSKISSHSGVHLEMQPRSMQPQALTFKSYNHWAAWITVFKMIVIASIVGASTYYLVSATIAVYGILGAVLFEVMPLAGVLFLKSKFWKFFLALLFLGVGVGTLNSLRTTAIAETDFISLDKNPEYQRLKKAVNSIQIEIDGMPANYRAKREEKRAELRPITNRMTEIEKEASGSTSSEAGRNKANVVFVVRIMIYIGAIALAHVLAEDIRSIELQGLWKRGVGI